MYRVDLYMKIIFIGPNDVYYFVYLNIHAQCMSRLKKAVEFSPVPVALYMGCFLSS